MDSEVLDTFGSVGVVQMKNIVERMRKECKSQTEQLILNDKLLQFLIESHRFKKYEMDKTRLMKAQNESVERQLKSYEAGGSSSELDEMLSVLRWGDRGR